MTGLVDIRKDGSIAVIVVDNPPVNALRQAVRAGLKAAFERARDDKTVDAVVLSCAGRTFISGADISEFGKPPQPPSLIEVIEVLDAMPKPLIAAMHGTALGGGLEIALGCHFRVAAPGTRLGLPEIKLGLIPGAGGTQRHPRLVGIDKALRMILSGNPVSAKEALADGLIDAVMDGDLTSSATAFARTVVAENRPARRTRDREDKLAAMRADPAAFDKVVATQVKRARGLHAPAAAVEAIRMALDVPIDAALKREREMFLKLLAGDQSKAHRHIFFAEREAAKVTDMPVDTKPREIARAAIIGAGTMGGGIAMCFANAGIPVTIIETGHEALTRGRDQIIKNYRTSVARGGLTQEEMDRRVAAMTGTLDFGAVSDADLVIEAVFEDMGVKKRVFADLDRLAKPNAILATNTSYLNVNAIAASTRQPQSVLGMHFFSPANVMRLLEVVRGTNTAPDVLATAIVTGRRISKVPVIVGVCYGFVGNRMLRARSIEGERLLLEGALPQDVDDAMVEFGFPMGPFAMGDLAGLDIGWRMRKAQGLRAEIADQLCEMGRFGQKTTRGYYLYEDGSRTPRPDAEVEQIIVRTSARVGIARRSICRQEIIERLIFPMINEGALILEEKIAQRPGDIDVIWIYGYGFPMWRGGPMYYADGVGLACICDRLTELARSSGDQRYEPTPLLARLAAEGSTFGMLAAAEPN